MKNPKKIQSYYLLTYACSPEGQQLLNEHRPCLSRERIGEMTVSAGKNKNLGVLLAITQQRNNQFGKAECHLKAQNVL
jgi:hypothetical protein